MNLIILVLVSVLFIITGSAQTKETLDTDIRLVKNRPHIYISFERQGEIAPLYEGQSDRRIWLRFQNNSKWEIKFCSEPVPKEYGEIGTTYEIERFKGFGETPGSRSSDACGYTRLKSGKSIIFSVPFEHLTEGLAIKVQYRYIWEFNDNGSDDFLEPQHYVFFYSSDILKN